MEWELQDGVWVATVNFSGFEEEGGGMTLQHFLDTHPLAAGDTLTANFSDESGGEYQGSFVEVRYDFGVEDLPDYTITGTDQDDLIYGSTLDDRLDGQDGDDMLIGREGMDIYIGGDGADTLDLSETVAATDTIDYSNVSEFGDTVIGFDVDDPALGGDQIDLFDVLAAGGFSSTETDLADRLQDAIDGGFLRFGGTDFNQVEVDPDGGGNSFVTVLTLDGLSYGTDVLAQAALDDNIIV
jgi:Ca2+-binding RTX toxin-like protein